MPGILNLILGGVGVVKDAYFNLVSLLLPGNGTNGAQNNTFLDSSTNNFTITRNGNTTQGTFSPFSQTGWSGAFNTSTTYLTVTDTANLRFGSANFTIEAWVYRNASGATQTIASKGASTPTGWVFQISSADKLVFTDTSTSITGATSIAANTWTYVAVVRAGTGANQTTLYVNGTSDGTGTSATNFNQTSNMLIGADRSTTNFANGYISNLRLSNTNRTISSTPTTALTADANTIFLSLNLNRFQYTDSTAAYTNISATGSPSVVAFSPFAPTAAYTTAAVGGSGYFDGTGDYLSTPYNANLALGSGNFTIEAWVYTNQASGFPSVFGRWSNALGSSWDLRASSADNSNKPVFAFNDGTTNTIISSSGGSVADNAWHHLAAVRNGNTITLYVDGSSVGSASFSGTIAARTSTPQYVGYNDSNSFQGYISNCRLITGQALATGNFTPPTAPVTASAVGWTGANAAGSLSGTVQFLTNFTNAGITDATAKNDLETVGNAQISTAISAKWGSGSIKLTSASSDYLKSPSSNLYVLGTGDWTIECWVYLPSVATQQIIFDTRATGTDSGYVFYVTGAGKLALFTNNTSVLVTSSSLPSNSWAFLAMTRTGATVRAYINGTLDATTGTYSGSMNCPGTALVGAGAGGTDLLNGYIQDVRITKGYARTITTPTAAFPTL
jgi:hypothetical protein